MGDWHTSDQIRDIAYKIAQRWIRSELDLRRSLATFDDLSKFLDLDFGNGRFFMRFTKDGTRKLRTRIRGGYDIGITREDVRTSLHQCLVFYGYYGGGCFD